MKQKPKKFNWAAFDLDKFFRDANSLSKDEYEPRSRQRIEYAYRNNCNNHGYTRAPRMGIQANQASFMYVRKAQSVTY